MLDDFLLGEEYVGHMHRGLVSFLGIRFSRQTAAESGHPGSPCWPVLTVWQVMHQTQRLTRVPLKEGI